MGLYAILIAGGTLPKSMRHLSASRVKALLAIDSSTLLERAARAVVESGLFDGVAAVGNAEVRDAIPQGCVYVPMGETMVDNVVNAYRHFGGDAHDYVVVSPDLPFISAAGLQEFIKNATGTCRIGIVTINRDCFLERFPAAPNKFEKLDGALATMGSVFYATGPAIQKNIPLIRDFFAARKKPWRLAVFLGLPILWAYLTGRLSSGVVERRLSLLMDCDVRAIRDCDPGLAYDIDTLESYEFARRLGDVQPAES